MAKSLRFCCCRCDAQFGDEPQAHACPHCSGPLALERQPVTFTLEAIANRPASLWRYAEALQNLDNPAAMDLVVSAVVAALARRSKDDGSFVDDASDDDDMPAYLKAMNVIETVW